MAPGGRRQMIGSASLILGVAAIQQAGAATVSDGHAAGRDVAAAPNPLALVPRKPGDAPAFTASLDRAPLKQTSGGWAREVTTRTLPIATGIAGAHLFLNPGGCREMHWHNSDEWAIVLDGHAQVTAIDPAGEMEVVNVAPGDLWYFPRDKPLNAILAFNDGLYAEHGTFGLSDWMSRLESGELAQALGVPTYSVTGLPTGETYIMQGDILPLYGPEAQIERPWPAARSHRFRLAGGTPLYTAACGTVHVAGRDRFPIAAMTGLVTVLQPGAMQQPHWHTEADEWHYVVEGRVRFTLFGPDKHLAVAELGPGECAYIPSNSGHLVRNIGDRPSEVVSVLNGLNYEEANMSDWLRQAPAHLLTNNLNVERWLLPRFPKTGTLISG
jgi:oxalate decarboxylase